jgi:hypothetical protein
MPKPFFEMLGALHGGRMESDLGDDLVKLIAAVKGTGKTAEITIKLKIKPPKNGSISYLTIEDVIHTKIPKLDRGDTVFFPTADNGLSRQDPSQAELPLSSSESFDRSTGEIIKLRSAN